MKYVIIMALLCLSSQYMSAAKISFNLLRCDKQAKVLLCASSKFKNLSHEGKPLLKVVANKNKTYSLALELTSLQASKYSLPESVKLTELELKDVDIIMGDFGYYDQGKFPFHKKLFKKKYRGTPFSIFNDIFVDRKKALDPELTLEITQSQDAKLQFSWMKYEGQTRIQANEEIHFSFSK